MIKFMTVVFALLVANVGAGHTILYHNYDVDAGQAGSKAKPVRIKPRASRRSKALI